MLRSAELSPPPLVRNLGNWVRQFARWTGSAAAAPTGGRNIFTLMYRCGSFLDWGAALDVEALQSNLFGGLLRKVVCDQDLIGAEDKAPRREVDLLHSLENGFLRARAMCLWLWAILHPTTAPLGAGPTYWAKVPVVSSCPMHNPWARSYDHSLGAWVLWLLQDSRGPRVLSRPFSVFGGLIRPEDVHLSPRWPGGFSASGWTEQQRLGDRMEMSSTLCYLGRNCPRLEISRKSPQCGFWNQMGHSSSLICFLPRPQGPSSLGTNSRSLVLHRGC